jgi:hypothetical protein
LQGTTAINIDRTEPFIGTLAAYPAYAYFGKMSSLRVVNSHLYGGDFTPSKDLTKVPNTILLLKATKSQGLVDLSDYLWSPSTLSAGMSWNADVP